MKVQTKKNPIISKLGVCDPHMHVFNDKVYLYASHDAPEGEHFFDMHDWEIWSSADFINWERESVVRPEDTSMGASYSCWAVDAAERNGKYYLYVSNGNRETYVFEADDPGKGFVDKLGKPMLPEHMTKTQSYDPTVFKDDDGSYYIIFGAPVWAGGDSYYIAKLNEDMVSLAETPRKIELDHPADDKSFLHKHNGIYYLSWGSFYATGDHVYGPYTFRGSLGMSGDHASFFKWNEQWFMAFAMEENVQKLRRATGITYIHYRENGEMTSDWLIREYGVGQYRAEWNQIEAQWYTKGYQVEKIENEADNFYVSMKAGSWVEFPNIHDIPENPWLYITCISDTDVDIEIYEDDRLIAVATKEKNPPPPDFKLSPAVQLPLSAGTHSLKFVTRGDLLLSSLRFSEEE